LTTGSKGVLNFVLIFAKYEIYSQNIARNVGKQILITRDAKIRQFPQLFPSYDNTYFGLGC